MLSFLRSRYSQHKSPIQWVPGAFALGVKRPMPEADHSLPSSAEVRNSWSYTSTLSCLYDVVLSYVQDTLWRRSTYEGVSRSYRTESISKYTLTTTNTRWEATQKLKASKLTRLTHKVEIQLHLVTESSAICSSRSRLQVRKLLDTPSYKDLWWTGSRM